MLVVFDLKPDAFKAARHCVVQFFYQQEMQSQKKSWLSSPWEQNLHEFFVHQQTPSAYHFFIITLCRYGFEHGAKIDALIEQHATNWKMTRMAKIDVAILRVLIAEMLCRRDVEQDVLLAESARIAYEYGAEHSASFVNGIMVAITKTLSTQTTPKTVD